MNSETLTEYINIFVTRLVQEGIAINLNSTTAESYLGSTLVSWVGASSVTPNHLFDSSATITEYLAILNQRFFTCVLFDGAIIQIQYRYEATGSKSLVWHRLCYYPCPVRGLNLLEIGEQETVSDLIAHHLMDEFEAVVDGSQVAYLPSTLLISSKRTRVRMRSPIRFDFDRINATANHPASHVHISDDNCRIPVSGPVSVAMFLNFIFEHFYADLWLISDFLRPQTSSFDEVLITDDETRRLHFFCK